jgi:hypothetical protein
MRPFPRSKIVQLRRKRYFDPLSAEHEHHFGLDQEPERPGRKAHSISNGESGDLSNGGLHLLSVQVRNGAFSAKLK